MYSNKKNLRILKETVVGKDGCTFENRPEDYPMLANECLTMSAYLKSGQEYCILK